jgi:hypothetical protein
MKLPITFEQFKSDPSKAIMFLLLGVVSVLYYRAEAQSKAINERCEKRRAKLRGEAWTRCNSTN